MDKTELRSVTQSDILDIDRLWQANWRGVYSMPNRNNAIVDAVVEGESGLVAYGQVKLFAEAMLFLDPTKPKRERVRALQLLMTEAFRGTRKAGIEELYAFIEDPNFASLIANRYGFKVLDTPGKLLLRGV